MTIRFVLTVFLLLLVCPAFAQDDMNMDQRLDLAKKMHELRPVEPQVNAAIDQVAMTQPEAEREAFRTAMRSALNYKEIEQKSVEAMAEIYALEELQAMVEYYSKPEAQSAAAKEQTYAARIYPEIIKMLDKALMQVRTGRP